MQTFHHSAAGGGLAETLLNNLLSIIPYWSSHLLNYLQLGNEYSMIVNLLLSHVFKTYATTFSDQQWVVGAGAFVLLLGLFKSHLFASVLKSLGATDRKKSESAAAVVDDASSLCFEGHEEKLESSGAAFCTTSYMPEIHAIHLFLRERGEAYRKYFFVEGRAPGDDFMIPMPEYLIAPEQQIYLSVSRSTKTHFGLFSHNTPASVGGNASAAAVSASASSSSSSSLLNRPKESTFVMYRLFMKTRWWHRWMGDSRPDVSLHQLILKTFMEELLARYYRHREQSAHHGTPTSSVLVLRGLEGCTGKTIDFHPYMIAIDKHVEENNLVSSLRSMAHSNLESQFASGADPAMERGHLRSPSQLMGDKDGDGGRSNDLDDNDEDLRDLQDGGAFANKFSSTLDFPNEGVSSVRCKLADNIYLDAVRQDLCITYRLRSEDPNVPIHQWMEALYKSYKQKKTSLTNFKQSLILKGYCVPFDAFHNQGGYKYYLSEAIWSLGWYLNEIKNREDKLMVVKTFRDYQYYNGNILYKYVVGPTGHSPLHIEDDVYLKVVVKTNTKNVTLDSSDSSRKTEIQMMKYILLSNTTKLTEFVDRLEEQFYNFREETRLRRNRENEEQFGKRQMYFQYMGTDSHGELQFEYSYITNSKKGMECYISQETVFHEHKQYLIDLMAQLDDVEYYRRTGRNRKAGVLLHGPPGTMKTGSAFWMAMMSGRHVISVDLKIVKTNEEFYKLMNVKQIHEIFQITDRNTMYFFDEIEKGLQQLLFNELSMQNDIVHQQMKQAIMKAAVESKNLDAIKEASASSSTAGGGVGANGSGNAGIIAVTSVDASPLHSESSKKSSLSYSTVLTLLDPGNPKHGALYVAAANEIDFLPDAFKRDLRLTCLYLGPNLRKDAYLIVRQQFNREKNPPADEDKYISLFADRFWIATKLIAFAEHWRQQMSMEEFIETKIVERQASATAALAVTEAQ